MQTTKTFKVWRFLNKDAVQKINMYSYCENDPINYVDPNKKGSTGDYGLFQVTEGTMKLYEKNGSFILKEWKISLI